MIRELAVLVGGMVTIIAVALAVLVACRPEPARPKPQPPPTPMEQLCTQDKALCNPPPIYGPGGFVPEVE